MVIDIGSLALLTTINLIFPSIISKVVNFGMFFFFLILKIIPMKLKIKTFIYIMIAYFSSKFYVPGTFILAVIVQKRRDTRPSVVDRHLIQNLQNFYHIFFLYTSNSPKKFNSLGFFV